MRRADRIDALFMLAATAAAIVLIGLGAGLTFFSDEWAFIETRALGDPATWFEPHNEHWATLAILAYRALVETVGLSSYMPYLGLLIALHVTVAGLVYTLVRRTSGAWAALAVGIVTLFLGSGFENLYWGFQIGFVGSLATGLAAILAFGANPLTARRAMVGAGLLVASLATQGGPGLACCVAVAVELFLDPLRRRMVTVLAIPAAAYGAWYVAIGRVGLESHQGAFGLGGLTDVLPVVVIGFSTVAGALTGVGTGFGGVVVVAAALALVLRTVQRRNLWLAPRFVGSLLAVATLYGLIGFARSFVGPDVAQYTRYTYISAALLIVGVSAQVGRPQLDASMLRRVLVPASVGLLVLSLIWNVRLLIAGRTLFLERTDLTRAFVTAALARPLPATTDPDRTLVLVPSPNALARIVTTYGSPLNDILVPWAVPQISAAALAEGQRVVEEGADVPLPEPGAP